MQDQASAPSSTLDPAALASAALGRDKELVQAHVAGSPVDKDGLARVLTLAGKSAAEFDQCCRRLADRIQARLDLGEADWQESHDLPEIARQVQQMEGEQTRLVAEQAAAVEALRTRLAEARQKHVDLFARIGEQQGKAHKLLQETADPAMLAEATKLRTEAEAAGTVSDVVRDKQRQLLDPVQGLAW